MYRLFLFLTLFISCKSHINDTDEKSDSLHSTFTNDDYVIKVRLPDAYNERDNYHMVVVADGSIGLGEYVLGNNEDWKATIPSNTIIITIGHIGDWEANRRRDFIPSDISLNTEENFGKADLFYSFLKSEFIPFINEKYPNQKSKAFIGHSFSGLFCLYAALKNEKLFDYYFGISSSVWANYDELLKIEEAFAKSNSDLAASIDIYVGGLEIFNKVISSSTEFYNTIKSRNYKSLNITYETIGGANHFSVRKPAIDKILLKMGKME